MNLPLHEVFDKFSSNVYKGSRQVRKDCFSALSDIVTTEDAIIPISAQLALYGVVGQAEVPAASPPTR